MSSYKEPLFSWFQREQSEEDFEDEQSVSSRRTRHRGHVNSNMNAIKMQIPSFKGKVDAEAYLE